MVCPAQLGNHGLSMMNPQGNGFSRSPRTTAKRASHCASFILRSFGLQPSLQRVQSLSDPQSEKVVTDESCFAPTRRRQGMARTCPSDSEHPRLPGFFARFRRVTKATFAQSLE